MVWTVSRVTAPEARYVISRRPHRLFYCPHAAGSSTCFVDISWQMGVVFVSTVAEILLFSIERDELIRTIKLHDDHFSGFTALTVLHLSVSSSGSITVILEADQCQIFISFTVGGFIIAQRQFHSTYTTCVCPAKNDVLLCGFSDGSVEILEACSLQSIYSFIPHIEFELILPVDHTNAAPREESECAILNISVGPDPIRPTLIIICAQSGATYVKALPDFIAWTKAKLPASLLQLASAPFEAIRGQAQAWTSEIKSFATDAMEEAQAFAQKVIILFQNVISVDDIIFNFQLINLLLKLKLINQLTLTTKAKILSQVKWFSKS